MKTNELRGTALDWAVAEAEGFFKKDMASIRDGKVDVFYFDGYEPSNDWALGGAIIERERIGVWFCDAVVDTCGEPLRELHWYAEDQGGDNVRIGITPLEAAMRCYVASKLGDEVQIPEEVSDATKTT
jgi:hypothetical protein